jgi:hypothetical protein
METDILKATLLESKWRLEVGDLSDYQALIFARDAVDAYIQHVRPYATFEPRTVDWSRALPPTAELELLIQTVVLLVLDLELIETE